MVTILIADDHTPTGQRLGVLIKQQLKSSKLWYACSYQNMLERLRQGPVDMIVLDPKIPGGIGPQMVRRIKTLQQNILVLIFSASDELEDASDYLQTGAEGFLSKSCSDPQALDAVLMVLGGRRCAITSHGQHLGPNGNAVPGKKADLTTLLTFSERELLSLLVSGKRLRQIAAQRNMELATVRSQKSDILKKLGLDKLSELTTKIWQLEAGW